MHFIYWLNVQVVSMKAKKILGTKEKAQLVQCLPHKCEDLSLIPRMYMKKLGMMVHGCNSSVGKGKTSVSLGSLV